MTWADLLADQPIDSPDNDLLDRAGFAKLLANAIVEGDHETAGVYAVCGDWGAGKTSLAKLIERELIDRANVGWFEPWMVGTSEALAREFFVTLTQAQADAPKQAGQRWRAEPLVRYGGLVLEAVAAAGTAIDKPTLVMIAAAKGVGLAASAAKAHAEDIQKRAKEPSLREAREKAVKELRKLKKPIVLVVDDIDRLDDEDIRTLFRVVKACADFPNVRYLLLFDRSQVTAALGNGGRDGQAFMEKIVTAAYDLPQATQDQSRRVLVQALEPVGDYEIDAKSRARIAQVANGVLLPGLGTVRAIKRFVVQAATLLRGVAPDRQLNVDIADFFALEYLRQQEPDIYAVLRASQDHTPGGIVALWSSSFKPEEVFNKALQDSMPHDDRRKSIIDEALSILGRDGQGVFAELGSTEEAIDRRFRSRFHKPIYFGYSAARTPLSVQDFQSLRISITKGDVKQWLSRLDDPDHRNDTALLLAIRTGDLTPLERAALLPAMFAWGERQSYIHQAPLRRGPMSWRAAVTAVCTSLLAQLAKDGKAIMSLFEAVRSVPALIGPAVVVHKEAGEHRRGGGGEWCPQESINALEGYFRNQLNETVFSGGIWELRSPSDAFDAWASYVSLEDYQRWRLSLRDDPKSLALYLEKIITTYVDEEGNIRIAKESDDPLLAAVEALPDGGLSDKGREGKLAYLNGVVRNDPRESLWTPVPPQELPPELSSVSREQTI